MRRLIIDWLPPTLWAAVILSASTDTFSSTHTGGLLERITTWLFGHPLAPPVRDALNFMIRKIAHLTEYGLLGALTFRALRGEQSGWSRRWAIGAVAAVIVVASIDEIHQTFVPSRIGTWHDVALDAAGAMVALLLIRAAQVLPFRRS